jgi:hypothetical protein
VAIIIYIFVDAYVLNPPKKSDSGMAPVHTAKLA